MLAKYLLPFISDKNTEHLSSVTLKLPNSVPPLSHFLASYSPVEGRWREAGEGWRSQLVEYREEEGEESEEKGERGRGIGIRTE